MIRAFMLALVLFGVSVADVHAWGVRVVRPVRQFVVFDQPSAVVVDPFLGQRAFITSGFSRSAVVVDPFFGRRAFITSDFGGVPIIAAPSRAFIQVGPSPIIVGRRNLLILP